MIIPRIGRRSPRLRAIIVAIYAVLAIGAVTMVVPFMITMTGAVSNNMDVDRYSVVPGYFFSARERYLKFLAEKYGEKNNRFAYFATAYRLSGGWSEFRNLGFEDDPVGRFLPVYERRIRMIQDRTEERKE